MSGATTAVVPDRRPGSTAFDAVILAGGRVLDKRRFDRREAALAWTRRRVLELFPELRTVREHLTYAGYAVRVEPAPREGEAGFYAFAEVEGKVVGTGHGATEEEALLALAGELGVEVPR